MSTEELIGKLSALGYDDLVRVLLHEDVFTKNGRLIKCAVARKLRWSQPQLEKALERCRHAAEDWA